MKCVRCDAEVGHVFLEKVQGTFVKDGKGKKRLVCSVCQRAQGERLPA